jgi:hypothetical protein
MLRGLVRPLKDTDEAGRKHVRREPNARLAACTLAPRPQEPVRVDGEGMGLARGKGTDWAGWRTVRVEDGLNERPLARRQRWR